MDEFILYEQIKTTFNVEKGKALFIEVTSAKLSALTPELLETRDDCSDRVCRFANENRPYALFDYLNGEKLIFAFRGKTFMQIQVLSTGEILDFATFSSKIPTADEIREEFSKLGALLRNSKAS